mgnify:CR=1 FL=1|tara:strand:+ start:2449 stop:2847 length:399 start_codon:yes stop_codon:yes gene_type:complete
MTRPTSPTAKNVNLKRLARTPLMKIQKASQKRLNAKKKAEKEAAAKAARMKEVMNGQAAFTARYQAEQKAKQERDKKERMAQEAKGKRERQRAIRSIVGVKMPDVIYKNLANRYGETFAKTFRANVGNLSKE